MNFGQKMADWVASLLDAHFYNFVQHRVLNCSEMNILRTVMNNHAINTYLIKITKIIAMPVCIHCIIADENVTCSFRLLVLRECELHGVRE